MRDYRLCTCAHTQAPVCMCPQRKVARLPDVLPMFKCRILVVYKHLPLAYFVKFAPSSLERFVLFIHSFVS